MGLVDVIKEVRLTSGTPTFMACKGYDLNTILGIDYLPEDHTFEVDFNKSTLTDVTLGKVFNI